MAYKIKEAVLCPDCERLLTEAHIVHKPVPYTEGTRKCERCNKKRYCTKYKLRLGKGEDDAPEADQ